MNLRLIKNIEYSKCYPYDSTLVLQTSEDNYTLGDYQGIKLTLFNILENSTKEVASSIKKYDFVEVEYISERADYLYFVSAEFSKENEIKIMLYQHNILDESTEIVFEQEVSLEYLSNNKIKVYVLNDEFAFVQAISTSGKISMCELISFDEKNVVNISSSDILNYGIKDIQRIDGNNYVLRIGADDRLIVNVNIKQFISELLLGKEDISYEIIEENDGDKYYAYVKTVNKVVIYSRFYFSDNKEEIVFYDYELKSSKVRMNLSDGRTSSKENAYMIGDVPYMLDYIYDYESNEDTGHYVLINLNSSTLEYSFEPGVEVKYIYDNIVITMQSQIKGILKRSADYICAYALPNLESPVINEKGQFAGCIANDDEILIFSN